MLGQTVEVPLKSGTIANLYVASCSIKSVNSFVVKTYLQKQHAFKDPRQWLTRYDYITVSNTSDGGRVAV